MQKGLSVYVAAATLAASVSLVVSAVTTGNLNKSKTSVTFTVTNVTRSGDTYASSSNHDSEGDSNGTSITILKP